MRAWFVFFGKNVLINLLNLTAKFVMMAVFIVMFGK